MESSDKHFEGFAETVLAWFKEHGRDLPWRDKSAGLREPYVVWLCEVMMQQTTIPHGTPYLEKFLKRWPTVENLAAAKDEDVMAEWAGLGYYARARNLIKCAREVVALGGFPETAKELKALPGIGPYTSGAIAALAFNKDEAAVDGNVERVFSRLLATQGEWKAEKKRIRDVVSALVPSGQAGAFAEAQMDIGSGICKPRSPSCLICPIKSYCKAHREGEPERYPIKPKKADLPKRQGRVYVLFAGGKILVERRADKGLLGGMLGLPTSEWAAETPPLSPPAKANWQSIGEVRHVFTHFALTLDVQVAEADTLGEGVLALVPANVRTLPTVFAKAARLALKTYPQKVVPKC